MTLDLARITTDLDAMVERDDEAGFAAGMTQLESTFPVVEAGELRRRLPRAKTSWLLARPHGAFDERVPAPAIETDYTVVASDGSFILPDRHTPARFYLINLGKVVLRYGSAPGAELSAEPTMYYREDELYISNQVRRVPVNGAVLGLKRAVEELRVAAEVALEQPRPVLALQDGTLILWSLESQPDFVRDWVLPRYLETLRALRDARIPVAAFISFPASSDVVNSLRVAVCDYPSQGRAVDCDHCRGLIPQGRVPACDWVPEITDRALFEQIAALEPGERSALFGSSSKILLSYDDDCRILFFYLHTGTEVARVEIPRWLAEDRELLDFTQAAIYEQCQLGRGYPSALQEAHEQAAIRPEERRAVDRLIEEALARKGDVVRRSGKDASKRGRFI
ncbi:MAG TPA: DNA double-strand break repair nuclease NurA [Thermomicrobiaceae bacterium]|nr:DNA double-strand break repair nuclease NurA [Thermomicrobiaceae bacterium]